VELATDIVMLATASHRVIARRQLTTRDLARVHAGRVEPLGVGVANYLLAAGPRAERLLIQRDRKIGTLDLASDAFEPLVGLPGAAAFVGDKIAIVDAHGLQPGGPGGARIALPPADTEVRNYLLSCRSTELCVVARNLSAQTAADPSNGHLHAEVLLWHDGRLEPPLAIPDSIGGLALSPDGHAFAMTTSGDPAVQIIDVATGQVHRRSVPPANDCGMLQYVTWSDELYASQLCANASVRVLRMPVAGPPSVVLQSEAWIGGIAALGDGDMIISRRRFNSELVLIDGL
jgi:hypothetical protein